MAIFRIGVLGALFILGLVSSAEPSQAQAVLSLDASAPLVRGTKSSINLTLAVKAKAVSFHKLYIKLRCKELVDLTQTVAEEKEEKGKKVTSNKSINVKKEAVLFEREINFAVGKDKEFAPGSTQTLTAEVEIPADLPPSFRGKLTQVKWEAQAQGDVVSKFWDALSPMTEYTVK
jgi:hypothetical protein